MLQLTYGKDVKIVVRRATVADDLTANLISRNVQSAFKDGEWGVWNLFSQLCSCSVRSKGLPFDPSKVGDTTAEQQLSAYNAFLALDKALKDRWKEAVDKVNEPTETVLSPVEADDPNW